MKLLHRVSRGMTQDVDHDTPDEPSGSGSYVDGYYEGQEQATSHCAMHKRDPEDTDIEWTETAYHVSVYVLAENEVLTISDRNKSIGPSAVVYERRPNGIRFDEYHVNSPAVWEWISRLLRDKANLDIVSRCDDD